jgi:hypothetical protein
VALAVEFPPEFIAGRRSGFEPTERRLVVGLTVAQAAATLTAVTIGTEAGIVDENLLSATLVVASSPSSSRASSRASAVDRGRRIRSCSSATCLYGTS